MSRKNPLLNRTRIVGKELPQPPDVSCIELQRVLYKYAQKEFGGPRFMLHTPPQAAFGAVPIIMQREEDNHVVPADFAEGAKNHRLIVSKWLCCFERNGIKVNFKELPFITVSDELFNALVMELSPQDIWQDNPGGGYVSIFDVTFVRKGSAK